MFEGEKNSAGTRLVELRRTTVSTSRNPMVCGVSTIQHENVLIESTELMAVEGMVDGSDMIRYPTLDDLAPACIC